MNKNLLWMSCALMLSACQPAPQSAGSITSSTPVTESSVPSSSASAEQAFLTQHNLNGKTPEEMVEYIDQLPAPRPLPFNAGVTSKALLVGDGTQQYEIPLSGDKFYVSVAPYINKTHECVDHSLSGCQGEMVKQPFHVKIIDEKQQVIMDKDISSYKNGFFGLWLPRNKTMQIEVTQPGYVGKEVISTNDDSQTCITTLRLSATASSIQ